MPARAGRSWLLLGVALASACSDDGLANQSAGHAESSTTGTHGSEGHDATTGPGPGTTEPDPDTDTTAPPSETGSSSEGTTTQTGSSSTGEGTTTTSESTSSGSDGTTTGEPSQACAEGCVVEHSCGTKWRSEADCVAACEDNLVVAGDFSIFCRAAWEAVSSCVGTLTCEEFEQWLNPMMFPYPCSDADTVLSMECEGQ